MSDTSKSEKMTYESAGVDIEAGNELVRKIKSKVRSTFSASVMADIGSFGSMLRLKDVLQGYDDPILIQSIDGVGTKVSIGCKMGLYSGLGRDIVNHATDDILVHGAKPITFLDYVASQKLDPTVVASIVDGMADACIEAGISLVGGETAEMPPTYCEGEIDIAGCITGVVEKSDLITGEEIEPGAVLVGLASSGLHTNGYSLARKVIFDVGGYDVWDVVEGFDKEIGKVLLESHMNYFPAFDLLKSAGVLPLGMAHITGGGFLDNIPRMLPENTYASIQLGNWPVLKIFELIQKLGKIDRNEMYHAFNMGIGMVWAFEPNKVKTSIDLLGKAGYPAYEIGSVKAGESEFEFLG